MSSHNILERITPTQDTLDSFFLDFPDHKQRYHFAYQFLKPWMKIADIACGVGYGSWLMSQRCSHVYGVDVSKDALKHAKTHFQAKNIDFIDANDFEFPGQLDVIISFETIEHMDEIAGDLFLKNIKKNLTHDGLLIISTPINKTPYKHNVNEFHIREYDDNEFPEKLKMNGFAVLEMYGQGSDFHKKLYGSSNQISIFNLMKLGVHRFLPQAIRGWLKKLILGNPNEGLSISKDSWRDTMVQIAICKTLN
jgi:2-polyprenyl-3-methyl-5-hydroxy-6-metoxy-1,4-benzoquinol methylase